VRPGAVLAALCSPQDWSEQERFRSRSLFSFSKRLRDEKKIGGLQMLRCVFPSTVTFFRLWSNEFERNSE